MLSLPDGFYSYGYAGRPAGMAPGQPVAERGSVGPGMADGAQAAFFPAAPGPAAGTPAKTGPGPLAPVTRVRRAFPETWIWTDTLVTWYL